VVSSALIRDDVVDVSRDALLTGARSRLDGLFAPSSVCIIGASANRATIAGRPHRILAQHGFTGSVYPVNPRYESIDGLTCYPTVSALPEVPDVAIVVIGANGVPDVLEECGQKGIRHAIIISSGFEEDASGHELVAKLKAVSAKFELNVVGPNSEGLWSVPHRAMMTFGSAAMRPSISEGRVSIISQSGSIGGNTARSLQDRGLGCRFFVSAGNETILTAADYLEYMVDEGGSDVVLLFLEGIVDGRRFIEAAQRAIQAGVVVVALKAGSSEIGGATAASHTGKITSPADVYADVFQQVGIVQVSNLGDLVEAADVFLTPGLRLPEKNGYPPELASRKGVALVAPGATRTVMADAAELRGVPLAEFSPETEAALDALIPSYGYARNPVDVTAQVSTAGMFGDILDLMAQDDGTEAVVIQWGNRGIQHFDDVVMTGDDLHRKSGKPVLIGLLGNPWELNAEQRTALRERGISCAMAPEDVIKQLDWLYTRRRFQERRAAEEAAPAMPVDGFPSAGSGVGFEAYVPWFSACGFSVPRTLTVRRGQTDVAAIGGLRFPIAVKAHPDEVAHKADRALVALNVQGVDDALSAASEMWRRAPEVDALLFQEMASPGVEVLVTLRDDHDFGPMLTLGVGGHLVELVKDVRHAALPLSRAELDAMIDETRLGVLLAGVRGQPPADRDALCAAVLRLANDFVDRVDRPVEVELNPVIVGPVGQGAAVVDVILTEKPC
jgi:acyl-CoA synthetase (NDP forming)